MSIQSSNALQSDQTKASTGNESGPRLNIDSQNLRKCFDREPFGFSHNLSSLDLFNSDSLEALAEKMSSTARDYFVAGSAAAAGTDFDSVPYGQFKPREALGKLGSTPTRILLKRPENHDARFRDLIEELFRQVVDLRGGMGNEKVLRLEGAVLISSAATTTPIHFDPEIGFFSQIEGEKFYHTYSPGSVDETELEPFYIRGAVAIGKLDLERRDPKREHVFELGPGKGLHQPQNTPHWVKTGSSRSVSYTFVFETDATRARGRTRAFNHYLRKVGVRPGQPGTHPTIDAVKSGTMRAVIPARGLVGRMLSKVRSR